MMWHGGEVWGWGSCIVLVVLGAAIIIAIVFAVRSLIMESNYPAALIGSASTRAEEVLAARIVRGGIDNDEFQRRLM